MAPRHPPRTGAAPLARIFAVMTMAAIASSLLFNLTTNGNGQLLRERLAGIVEDPALLGALLACVYVVASFAQVAIGLLIDRYPIKRLYLGVVALQVPLFMAAAGAHGWALFALQVAFMIAVFGAIPFTDAMIVRFVDDRIRSRVSGMRLFVSFGVSSAAVWLLGPVVKAAGFGALLWSMAAIAVAHAPRDHPAAVGGRAAGQRAVGAAAAIASRSRLKTPGAAAITSFVRRNSSPPAKSPTRPPASTTSSAPAATFHGLRPISQ